MRRWWVLRTRSVSERELLLPSTGITEVKPSRSASEIIPLIAVCCCCALHQSPPRSAAPLLPAPYGHMEKAYHPCYTNLNPAEEARRYTTETVHFRKVTLIYDWLDPDRSVESWFRKVPYRLERGPKGSWVVKYFEFRAGISPISQAGFIGDLWISWSAWDPSVWFKVDEVKWQKWGGCTSSTHEVSFIQAYSLFLPFVLFPSLSKGSYRLPVLHLAVYGYFQRHF